METRTWETLCIFDEPKNVKQINFIESVLEMPNGVEDVIRIGWNNQLELKQRQLAKDNISTEILPYHLDNSAQPLSALYEKNELKMWPGPVVSLKDIKESDYGIELLVGQTYFPFIEGLKNEKVSKLYEEQRINKPRPALAICTYALTQDNQITLTIRGPKTNIYPGRLYGQGGNPLFPDTNISKHQQGEMFDETHIEIKDYNPEAFSFGGIIVDKEQLLDKPDLVGWIPVNLESKLIQERMQNVSYENRSNDAIGVVFAPAMEGELFDYLANKTHPIPYCPSAQGGLVLYGHHNFGNEWSDKLLEKLNR